MTKLIDLTGQTFGRLTAISRFFEPGSKITKWLCSCECGATKVINADFLRRGMTKSCGCLHKEITVNRLRTHGMRKVPEYVVWTKMRYRCENPSDKSFPNYGGRGIKVCKRWQSFENFMADMGSRPSSAHSIDRINNNAHYSPDNCRWATAKDQANNRRVARTVARVKYKGQILTLRELSGMLGLNYKTVQWRYAQGWRGEKLVQIAPKFS